MKLILLLIFPALMVLSQGQPSSDPGTPSCYNSARRSVVFEQYWVPKQGTADQSSNGVDIQLGTGPQNVDLKDAKGRVIATVDRQTATRCQDVGTCLLANGDLINVGSEEGSFVILDKESYPFGEGSADNPLEPFVSISSGDVPWGTTLCVRQLENLTLPNNRTHNGCVRVDDDPGVPYDECVATLFVVEFPFWLKFQASINETANATVYPCSCQVLNYTTPDMFDFVNVLAAGGLAPNSPGPTPVPEPAGPTPVPAQAGPTPVPEPAAPTPVPAHAGPTPVPEPAAPTPVPAQAGPTPVPEPAAPTPVPAHAGPTPVPEPAGPTPVPEPANAPSGLPNSPKANSSKVGQWVGIAVGFSLFLVVLVLVGSCIWKQRRQKIQHHQTTSQSVEGVDEGCRTGDGPRLFSLSALRTATDGFHPSNKLGEGGFGAVYKGVLSNGTPIAVKQLSKDSTQGTREFMAEVTVIGQSVHENLVRLYGYCLQGDERLLVYEYMEKGCLQQALFGKSTPRPHLDWATRFNIIVGTVKGIAYLHQTARRIIHRDIKASNVLLDEHMHPKISDFGLARFFADDKSHISTKVAGTIGYLAPEYAWSGMLTEKADVFSFGVLVLVIVTGCKTFVVGESGAPELLLEWAWDLYEQQRFEDILDPKLKTWNEHHKVEEMVMVVQIALLCAQGTAHKRPTMEQVLSMLQSEYETISQPSRPEFLNVSGLKLSSVPVGTGFDGSGSATLLGRSSSSATSTTQPGIDLQEPRS